MRNLARLFLARGVAVTGSDLKDSTGLARARAPLGADVWVGHDAARLGAPDAVVISSAIGADERRARRGRASAGIPVWARQQALAALAAGHRGDRGRRHPRQDHDDLDGRRRAGAARGSTRPT